MRPFELAGVLLPIGTNDRPEMSRQLAGSREGLTPGLCVAASPHACALEDGSCRGCLPLAAVEPYGSSI